LAYIPNFFRFLLLKKVYSDFFFRKFTSVEAAAAGGYLAAAAVKVPLAAA
jgi:hypothetical protein